MVFMGCRCIQRISIHALLAESDVYVRLVAGTQQSISIHALLAESDRSTVRWGDVYSQFQSTLSLRRATKSSAIPSTCRRFQSTLSLRRATRPTRRQPSRMRYFNPRSPCGERQQIPPNWPYRFCLKCQFKDGEKSKKAKGSASAQASSPAYEKNKVRIPWGDFECFRFAPIK